MAWTWNNNATNDVMTHLFSTGRIVEWNQFFTVSCTVSWFPLMFKYKIYYQFFKHTAPGFRVNLRCESIRNRNTDTGFSVLAFVNNLRHKIPFIFSVRTLLHSLHLTSHLLTFNVVLPHLTKTQASPEVHVWDCVSELVQFEMLLEDKMSLIWTETWAHSVPGRSCYFAVRGGGVIFLEGCHHNGVLIDSSTTTPCLTPEALNPNCATQVTNKGPEANSSCIFIPNVDLTAAAFLVALLPRALFNTNMWFMVLVSLQSTALCKHCLTTIVSKSQGKLDVHKPY